MARSLVTLLCLVGARAATVQEGEGYGANPIRHVVTMLQNMQKKIAAEGERDAELYEKYMCYCTSGLADLKVAISAAETKVPQVESSLKESSAEHEQLGAEIGQHKQDKADAETALKKATELRKKEAAAHAKASADFEQNIAATGQAITALTKGAKGAFLQTAEASTVRQLAIDMELSSVDRNVLASFLSGEDGSDYSPSGGQVTGILKQMKETMEKDLAEAVADEKASVASYESLAAAKEKEIAIATESIETKIVRYGDLGVAIEHIREDLEDTKKQLAEDSKFAADLDKNCATKEEEYAAVKKTRSEEMLALADTIKLLNDDDALELFKKTLPTPALLQTATTAKETRRRALATLEHSSSKDPRIDMISLALHGKKVGFEKVVAMVENMIKVLQQEQTSDDGKKEYCNSKIDSAEDEIKELEHKTSNLEKAIKDAETAIKTLADEIASLAQGIKDLDKAVGDATATRKAENQEYTSTMNGDKAAKELLGMAKNRLNKFYSPKLYTAAPKRDLSEEERIVVNNGGTLAPTNAPGGISGTGITALVEVSAHSVDQGAPAPPPEAVGAYKNKGQESSGVVAMVDLLITDLEKEMTELTTEEDNAQAGYEKFIQDSADKRAEDGKSLADKEDAKADMESQVQKETLAQKDTAKEAYATSKVLRDLHLECDWLLSNYETRKNARTGEEMSLTNAKAVLSGADYE